jgi:arginine/serine-rich splicing factor 4/5/6
MRPIFCGNFDFEARQSDLERLFRRYGRVERVDMKSGFAFVYMEDERDAADAIRGLDRFEYGRKGRRLRVEWTKQERGIRQPVDSKRSSTNSRPSKTLFVINFDPYHTRTRDLEKHFDPYGKILNVRIRKNFAFIQYESEEDARRALDATNMSKLMDRVISVEFAIKDDDDRRNGYSPDRSRDRSPGRRAQDRGRSPSPYRRERASPDYGRGRNRASPDYGHGGPNTSPRKRERADSEYDHGRTRSPRRVRPSPDNHGPEPSPRERVVSPDYDRGHKAHKRSPKGERISPDDYRHSPSPQRERVSPDDYRRSPSPDAKHELRDGPKFDEAEDSPVQERYGSRSPVERERSRS